MGSKKTLQDFGYAFNKDGQLRKIEENGKPGEQPFQFNVSDNHQECQKHYEELGDVVTEYVYQLLETQEKLLKLPVPENSTPENGTFIYVTKDYDKCDNLLVLIHGSGVVRAGQWARSLIINDSIHSGSQIPYIRKATAKGYGLLIMNTNDNFRDGQKIKHSSTSEEHACYVWNKYVLGTSASKIGIVAHSYGGVVTVELASKMKEDFERRVKVVAFTDSVHNYGGCKVPKILVEIGRNWAASSKPLDSPIKKNNNDVEVVSAGTTKHEMTSYSCIESLFKYVDVKLNK